ncbi:Lon protease-like protein [Conyzicola nivalis]|uniref:Lon protease-like protein n=1 Tax=Conyzicola nivalis TaxID=1477021 RepID=A0ABV2QHP8_9MICO
MSDLPMFPLGSVLFPHMPLALRVFEERYIVMLSQILVDEPAEFGVVLIERGQEVGGGEQRFSFGTIAQILQIEAAEDYLALVAQGDRRVEVVEWRPDEPFPSAEVRELDELEWDDDLQPLRDRAEHEVRRALALASEFADMPWAASVEISDDPVQAAWQLAAISPLGPLDQVTLLRSTSMEQLLLLIVKLTVAATETLGDRWPGDGDIADDEND